MAVDSKHLAGRTPLVCQLSDVADVVTYLCSDATGYVTGQRIVVDSGTGSARMR